MRNYRDRHGCHNCKCIFVMYDYDSGDFYYCTKDAPKRPLCLSVSMEESPETMDEKVWQKACSDWNKWSENREVKPYGICDNWENKINAQKKNRTTEES